MSLPIYQRVAVTDAGDVIPGAEYTVINENTGVAAPIYSDRTGLTLLTPPYFADSVGTIQFFIAQGTTFRVAASGGVGTYTDRYVYGVAEAVLVQADGNVGIGTNSPESELHIVAANSTETNQLTITGSSAIAGAKARLGSFNDTTYLTNNYYYDSGQFGDSATVGAASIELGTGRVSISTSPAGTVVPAERMRIDSSGNVGIGTISPVLKLSVDGDIWQGNQAGAEIGRLHNEAGWYDFKGSTNVLGVQMSHVSTVRLNTNSLERMRIDYLGNALFGKTSVTIGNAGLVIGTPTAGITSSVPSGSNTYHVYKTGAGAGYTFYVSSTGTVNYFALNQLSDEREKKNIVDIPNGLNAIMSLKPRQFDWKDDEQADGVYGFIAQEVETVLPSLIGEYKKDKGVTRKSLSQIELIPVLTKAIQEQQALIEALTARIEALEAK